MGWFILAQLFSKLIALVSHGRLSEREKDLEILLLRQQISILLHNRDQPVRATQVEKLTLTVFTARLKEIINSRCRLGHSTSQAGDVGARRKQGNQQLPDSRPGQQVHPGI